jgi:hypothetical protein
MSETRYFFKFSYLTLKEDILCQKEDGRTWPKKEDMSSQRRTYGNPSLVTSLNLKKLKHGIPNSVLQTNSPDIVTFKT